MVTSHSLLPGPFRAVVSSLKVSAKHATSVVLKVMSRASSRSCKC